MALLIWYTQLYNKIEYIEVNWEILICHIDKTNAPSAMYITSESLN